MKDQVRDPSLYGVTEESTGISIRFKATTESGVEYNDTVALLLGGTPPEGDGIYAYADGFGVILLLDTNLAETLKRLAEDPPHA